MFKIKLISIAFVSCLGAWWYESLQADWSWLSASSTACLIVAMSLLLEKVRIKS